MWFLACSFGTGDTYLICALWRAFEAQHGPATIVVAEHHAPIAQMFGVRYEVGLSRPMAADFQEGTPFVVHPSRMAFGAQIDALTGREGFSQADMYRLLLRLSPDAPLAKPQPPGPWQDQSIPKGRSVVLMPHSQSWPPAPPEFWQELAKALLDRTDLDIVLNSGSLQPQGSTRVRSVFPSLEMLFSLMEHCGWVIGPNTGGFACAVSAEIKASKTMVVQRPATIPFEMSPTLKLTQSFPYSHQRKFDGFDYEVDEHELIDRASWAPAIDRIVASRPPIAPKPKRIVRGPMSVGDIVDRITILEIKAERLQSAADRLAAAREVRELQEAIQEIDLPAELVAALKEANIRGWELADKMYEDFPFGSDWEPDLTKASDWAVAVAGLKAHRAMMDANRDRVRARQQIDAASNSLLRELKSYSVA